MRKQPSSLDGLVRPDERLAYVAEDAAAAAGSGGTASTAGGLGVSYPIPWFGSSGLTYWRADNGSVATISLPDGGSQAVSDYGGGTDEDTEDGASMVTWWRIPSDCETLVIVARVVKKNGKYGRKIRWDFNDITDDERSAAFCERTLRGLRPKRVYDILIARSKGASKAVNPPSPFTPSANPPMLAGTPTRDNSMTAWPNPDSDNPIGYGPYGKRGSPSYPRYENPALSGDETYALARLDLRNYSPLQVRITAVGAAEKDRSGTYYPVTVTFTAGLVDTITLRGFRVGRKNPEDYTKYAKTYKRWRFQLSETDRDAGTAVLRVGPFGPRQAKHTWHITRIHAVDFRDDTQSRKTVEWYPATIGDCAGPDDIGIGFAASPSTDLDSTYHKAKSNSEVSGGRVPGAVADGSVTADTDDVSAGQATNWQNAQTSDGSAPADGGTAGKRRVLAVLGAGEHVDGKLANFTVSTAPDLDTEKADDAYIRFSADIQTTGGAASTAGDANATQAVFIFRREADGAVGTNYIRKRVDLNPTDTVAALTFHRKMGRKFHMVKMRLRNGISKVDTSLSTQTGGGLVSGAFRAGQTSGGAYVDTDAHLGIDNVSVTSTDFDSGESNAASVTVKFDNIGIGGLPVIPKKIFLFVNKRGQSPTTPYVPTSLADARQPSSSSWKFLKQVHVGDESAYVTVANNLQRQVDVPLRRKKTHKFCAAILVKGSNTFLSGNNAQDAAVLSVTGDSELPTGNYAHGNGNLIRGGSFIYSKDDVDAGGANTKPALRWKDFSTTPATPSSASDIDDSSANNIYWDKTNHCLVVKSGGTRIPACPVKKNLVPGETITVAVLLKQTGLATLPDVTLQAKLYIWYDDGTTTGWTVVDGTSAVIADINISTGAYKMGYSQVTVPSSYTRTKNGQLWLGVAHTPDAQMRTTNWMAVRGNQPMTWDAAAAESDWDDGSAATGYTSQTISDNTAGNFDANQGGFRGAGAGEITL